MNELKTFTFELNDIRVIDLDGKPMFVALLLGYANPNRSVGDHCKYAKSIVEINKGTETVCLHPQTKLIPESDLYRLIMRSDMPEAERFQDWVTEEVCDTLSLTNSRKAVADLDDDERGSVLVDTPGGDEKSYVSREHLGLTPVKPLDIRVLDQDGNPWFVAKDVCDVLGLTNSRKAVADLDDDEKDTVTISDGTPGNPTKTIISEPGLYSLILRSRKEEAKRFKRWVTHEILPTIRKTGGTYMTAEHAEKALLGPDFIIRMATQIKEIGHSYSLPHHEGLCEYIGLVYFDSEVI